MRQNFKDSNSKSNLRNSKGKKVTLLDNITEFLINSYIINYIRLLTCKTKVKNKKGNRKKSMSVIITNLDISVSLPQSILFSFLCTPSSFWVNDVFDQYGPYNLFFVVISNEICSHITAFQKTLLVLSVPSNQNIIIKISYNVMGYNIENFKN